MTTGTSDDLINMSLQWETNIKSEACSLEFDRKDLTMKKLAATSLEGKFHVFDVRTQHPTKGLASVSRWLINLLPGRSDTCHRTESTL